MKLEIKYSARFKRDMKKLRHDQKLVEEIQTVIKRLANRETLEPRYRDHPLTGNMKELRDCHIRNDVILVYGIEEASLTLYCMRVGSHSEVLNL